MPVDVLVANLALAVVIITLIWLAYTAWPETIRIKDGMLIKRHRFHTEAMRLSDLESVQFHYQAVIAFACSWEFTDKSGRTLSVGGFTFRRKLIRQLALHLPGFSENEFDRLFAAGDVEDSLEVWRATKPAGASSKTS